MKRILSTTRSLSPFFVKCNQKSPRQLGYSFPNEWAPRAGTLMIFPTKLNYENDTPGLRKEFFDIVEAIAANERVHIFCIRKDKGTCSELFQNNKNVTIHSGKFTIDWARDNAPMLIRSKSGGQLAAAGFRCNGWGKKYKGWHYDKNTRSNIAKTMNWPSFSSKLVLEGGAIEIANGIGISTESCTLNENRTKWPKLKVEEELKNLLGLDKIIWLKSGLVPDPMTDGHVDGLLKWISDDTVMLYTTDDKSDPNYTICQQAKTTLLSHNLNIIELPLADSIDHINFYIGSGGHIAYVPICGDPKQDSPALEIIRQHFQTVIPIIATNLYKAGGGIHCYTQQIPTSVV